jgi:hypothetical protein
MSRSRQVGMYMKHETTSFCTLLPPLLLGFTVLVTFYYLVSVQGSGEER